MATKEEIENLKNDWVKDPCWEIETTEGFEEHWDELLEYRKKMEAKWNEYYTKLNKAREEINNDKQKTFRDWLIMSIAQGALQDKPREDSVTKDVNITATNIILLADAIVTQLAKEKLAESK